MKKLIIGAALATILAAPALAQAYNPSYGTGNAINQPRADSAYDSAGMGAEVYNDARTPYVAPGIFAMEPRDGYADARPHRYWGRNQSWQR